MADLLHPRDLTTAATLLDGLVDRGAAQDWSVPAGPLEWSCLRTLDHIADALLYYAGALASRATSPSPWLRDGGASGPVGTGRVVRTAAAVLAAVVEEAPPDVRGHHPSGMADPEGFVGMGLAEVLIHGDDVATGLRLEWRPPDELAGRLRDRLFPWAPTSVEAWSAVRWACGRTALMDHPRLGPDWYWHSPPLDEWDGTRTVRTAPPGWR